MKNQAEVFKVPKEGIEEMENEFDMILRNVREESLDEGIGIGECRNSQKIARNMLVEGFHIPTIAKLSELTIEEVESIRRSIKA